MILGIKIMIVVVNFLLFDEFLMQNLTVRF